MFTGIVEGVGKVRNVRGIGDNLRMAILLPFEAPDVGIGDSISVDGVCLTVTGIKGKEITVDVSAETISRSTMGMLTRGDEVNLERALKLTDRLGGHLVSGHIDGTGRILSKVASQGSYVLRIGVDESISRYIIEKGSIAVDGISLTINRCQSTWFEVNIIPQTAKETGILKKEAGSLVNVETDMIGKYVEKFLALAGDSGNNRTPKIDRDFLSKHGFGGMEK
ncbi:MAG: riboflavin synthase [Deltaproteobacteria bacterium]|nr:riboflavin synthase [Deltaproteobacteria bacterium]